MAWQVAGTKKGGWPLAVEKRKNHKVTVIRNVSGDPGALVAELKGALGTGGVARDGCIEIQGDHEERVHKFLMASGRVHAIAGLKPPKKKFTRGTPHAPATADHAPPSQPQPRGHAAPPPGARPRAAGTPGAQRPAAVVTPAVPMGTGRLVQRRGGGKDAAFHRFVGLMKSWVYWEHDYTRLEELWEQHSAAAGGDSALRGAAFMEDAPAGGAATRPAGSTAAARAAASDDKLHALGMLAAPSAFRESRAERQRTRKAASARAAPATGATLTPAAAPRLATTCSGTSALDRGAAPSAPLKPHTASWYAALATGHAPPSSAPGTVRPATAQSTARAQHRPASRARSSRGKYGSSRRRAAPPAAGSGGGQRRAGGSRGPYHGALDGDDEEGAYEYGGDLDGRGSSDSDEGYAAGPSSHDHSAAGLTSDPGGLSSLVEAALSRCTRQLGKTPAAVRGLPHVECAELWGDHLDEEAALQLALHLSLADAHPGGAAAAPVRDDDISAEQEERDVREALARSCSDPRAPAASRQARVQDDEAEDSDLRAAIAASRLPQARPPELDLVAGQGRASWFQPNWWMGSGGAATATVVERPSGSDSAQRTTPEPRHGLPSDTVVAVGGCSPVRRRSSQASNTSADGMPRETNESAFSATIRGDMSEEQALELALQLSTAAGSVAPSEEMSPDEAGVRLQPSRDPTSRTVGDVAAIYQDTSSRDRSLSSVPDLLAVIIGDDDAENLEVLMEFLQGIGSTQGVSEYLQEVILEREASECGSLEQAWASVDHFTQRFAELYGW
eukprot:jgi/Tetstr1/458209/TSEL_044697.t1